MRRSLVIGSQISAPTDADRLENTMRETSSRYIKIQSGSVRQDPYGVELERHIIVFHFFAEVICRYTGGGCMR
jgi:hypothetical protein